MHLLYTSTAFLALAKSLAIASPYILKHVIDAMAVPGTIDFQVVAAGILLGGLTRMLSTTF